MPGAALALVAALSVAVPASARDAAPRATTRLLVKFASGADRTVLHRLGGGVKVRTIDGLRSWELVAAPANALAAYRGLPGVVDAQPNVAGRVAAAAPDDPCIWTACGAVSQWNLASVNAPLGWEMFPPMTAQQRTTSDPVVVAVLDSRIDSTHPDFANAGGRSSDATDGGQIDWSRQQSWVPASKRAGSLAWHGTFVAGLLAASAGNGIDLAGVAYPALIIPYEVVDGEGVADAAAVAEAIVAANRAGAHIINMSLGFTADSPLVREAMIAATTGPGASLIVAAAGNNTRDTPFYPASYPEALSVAGIDATGAPAVCSNYNDNVSVAAPARTVLSLSPMPQRLRVIDCGTSAAAPHVAGLAALLLAQDRTRTPADLRAIIERTADDDALRPGRDRYLGFGRINVDRALRETATAVVDSVEAPTPRRNQTTVVVSAVARSATGITAADLYVDAPGNPSARITMQPADGTWGGTVEQVTATIAIDPSAGNATRALHVRAFDGAWGTTGRGLLRLDREPPRITNVRADTVVRAEGKRPSVTFTLWDDTATAIAYAVAISGPDGSTVWSSGQHLAPQGARSVYWTPPSLPLGMPGPHRIEIWAWDEAGNPAAAAAQTVVI